jgi:hypothetical protein
VFTGEVLVVPRGNDGLMKHLSDLSTEILEMSWKLYDVVVVPVEELEVPRPGTD